MAHKIVRPAPIQGLYLSKITKKQGFDKLSPNGELLS